MLRVRFLQLFLRMHCVASQWLNENNAIRLAYEGRESVCALVLLGQNVKKRLVEESDAICRAEHSEK